MLIQRGILGEEIRSLIGLEAPLEIAVEAAKNARLRVLVVAAHPDDKILGAGATLATLSALPSVAVFWVVVGAEDISRRQETQRAADLLGMPAEQVFFLPVPDGTLDQHAGTIRQALRLFAHNLLPDLVLTHRRDDGHSDHTTLYDLVRQIFAKYAPNILNFLIPQLLPGEWNPAAYVRVPDWAVDLKLGPLFGCYQTQQHKSYFDVIQGEGILRGAGLTAGCRFAEPFEITQLFLTACSNCGALVLARNPANTPTNGVTAVNPLYVTATRVVLEPCHECCAITLARHTRCGTPSASQEGGHNGAQ